MICCGVWTCKGEPSWKILNFLILNNHFIRVIKDTNLVSYLAPCIYTCLKKLIFFFGEFFCFFFVKIVFIVIFRAILHMIWGILKMRNGVNYILFLPIEIPCEIEYFFVRAVWPMVRVTIKNAKSSKFCQWNFMTIFWPLELLLNFIFLRILKKFSNFEIGLMRK